MDILKALSNRLTYYTTLIKLESENKKRKIFNTNNTIAVIGSPRGGSTWLSELLTNIENSVLAIEPLYRGIYKMENKMPSQYKKGMSTKKLNFWYYQPILENEQWVEAENFFYKLFNRELLKLSIFYENDLKKIPNAETYIFKFCFAHLMLPWFSKKFDITPIFLIRHPCATVQSQLQYGSWDMFKTSNNYSFNFPKFRNSDYFNKWSSILSRITTPEENLAAMWSMSVVDNINHEENDRKWITVSYEKLVLDPEVELSRIFQRLRLSLPESILSKIKIPSKTVDKASAINFDPPNQLNKWKRQLSKKQINNIMTIVKEFGVDFYTEDVEPVYSKIYSYD